MHTQPLSTLNDYELTNKSQDVRGWPVKDSRGAVLGTVREMIVDTDEERVTSLVLDTGKQVPVSDVMLADHVVLFGARRSTPATNIGTRGARAAAATTGTTGPRTEEVIPVVEERIEVGKRQVGRGAVHAETHVVAKPVEQQVNLREEKVSVERRPVDRPVTPADAAAFKDRTVDVTATAEELVVGKTARVIEEVVIRKDVATRTETVRDTVRRTEVTVDGDRNSDVAYRQHFQQAYGSTGATYDQYAPAYRFGSAMHQDSRFTGRTWNDVEPKARTAWEETNPGTWDRFKDAVRHAWHSVTGN